ncbi:MAG: DUF1365 domain-containing protein [Deltaproteobacteria bacterium]|nr:DUF1365 domain-containing protein [Deltaproteobacteria bacterium]
MHSCIYEGSVRHRRFRPRPNMFRYRLFFMYLDLAELPHVFDGHPLWSYQRPNIAYFRRKDHFGDPRKPIDVAVRDLVAAKTGRTPEGPVRMLTHLRYFGYCFNPASFYYCYDRTDSSVETIIVEIHNTPWGEVHCYVLDRHDNEHPVKNWRRHRFAKVFHVSPFIDMNINYDWRFREPDTSIRVHMIDYENEQLLFDASLALKRRQISRRALTDLLIKYPLMTAKVTTLIYWQALRLLLKKTPMFVHPKKRHYAGGRYQQ